MGVSLSRLKPSCGLFKSSDYGFTLGSNRQDLEQQQRQDYSLGSLWGSTQGDVQVQVDNRYQQKGSSLLSPKGDIKITAESIDVLEERVQSQSDSHYRTRQDGLSLSFSNDLVNSVQSLEDTRRSANNVQDKRIKALAAASAALSVKNQ